MWVGFLSIMRVLPADTEFFFTACGSEISVFTMKKTLDQ